MKIIKFKNWDCKVNFFAYSNKRTAIELSDIDDGQPIAIATINVPEIELEKDEVIIKNYSENEGILDCLIDNHILIKTGKKIEIGYVTCEICKLLNN
jgi:hypothetical protein